MPRKVLATHQNFEQLPTLMRLALNLEETAAALGVHTSTVTRFIRKKFNLTFKEFRARHTVHTRMGLVRRALEMAQDDPKMLKFCLINLNGWSNNPRVKNEHTSQTDDLSDKTDGELQAHLTEMLGEMHIQKIDPH